MKLLNLNYDKSTACLTLIFSDYEYEDDEMKIMIFKDGSHSIETSGLSIKEINDTYIHALSINEKYRKDNFY